MKRLFSVSVICVILLGCSSSLPDPPGMFCLKMPYMCIDGSYPEACVSYDGEDCTYKIMDRYFECDRDCECERAAERGVSYCMGALSLSDDDNVFVQEMLDTMESIK